GWLAYAEGTGANADRTLVWVDRSGASVPLPLEPHLYWRSRLSPGGDRLVTTVAGATTEIWVFDLARGTSTRVTTGGADQWPIWTPDGRRVVYTSARMGGANLFWKPVDDSGPEERLTTTDLIQYPGSWSPDGRLLAFVEGHPVSGSDIWILPVEGDRRPWPFVRTPFNEDSPAFSPDGHSMAYRSDESGR